MLSNPMSMDLLVFAFLTIVQWGTLSGVMVASLGALICSALISLRRCLFGYIERKVCQPGLSDIGHHLPTPTLLAA